MIQEDTAHSDAKAEIITDALNNSEHPYEHLSCPTHRGYQLQILCTKENFTPSLLCIKCLIDPATQKQVSGDDLIYIRDAVSKGLSDDVSESQIQAAKEKLENKFTEFTSVDYLGKYEQHSNNQLKKLEREIVGIKERLDYLYSQFKQLFDRQFKLLENKQEGLTVKIQEFIDEQEEVDNLRNSSVKQVTAIIREIIDPKHYGRLVKALHQRGKLNEGVTDGTMLEKIFDIIDGLKSDVSILTDFCIETTQFKEIRHRIESLELIDQSLQIGSNGLPSSDTIDTLEKIRNAGKKKGYVSPQRDQKGGMLGQFQERLANLDSKEAPIQTINENKMQIELLPMLEFPVKKEKVSEVKDVRSDTPRRLPIINPFFNEAEQAINLEKAIKSSDALRIRSDAATQTINFQSASKNTNYDNECCRRQEPIQKRQKTSMNSYRVEKSSREKLSEINFHEEGYEEGEDNRPRRHYRGYAEDEEFSFHHLQKREPYDLRPRSASNSVTKSYKTNSNQKMRNIKQEARGSPYKPFGGGGGGIKDRNYYNNTYPRVCDVYIKGEEKSKKRGQGSRGRRNSANRDQCSHDGSCFDSNEEGGNEGKKFSVSKLSKKPKTGRGIHGLHDWINRRITGYLIYQNTVAGTIERDREGCHLNSIAGQQWKKLSKVEKEEYKSLALNVRVNLKKEYRDVDKESPELKELQDLIEKEIKRIKKE